MKERFKLAPGLRVLADPGRRVVAGEDLAVMYDNPVVTALLDRLGEGLDSIAAVAALESRFSTTAIEQALRALMSDGVITPWDDSVVDEAAAAFWLQAGHRPGTVHVIPRFIGIEPLYQPGEFTTSGSREQLPLTLICTDDYLRPEVAAVIAPGHATLLARPVGRRIWIGPLLVTGQPVCWSCLAHWLQLRRWRQAAVTNWVNGAYPPEPVLGSTKASRMAAWGMILSVIDRFGAERGLAHLQRNILVFDSWSGTTAQNPVMPLANCRTCSIEPPSPASERLQALTSPVSGILENTKAAVAPALGLHFAVASVLAPLPNEPHLGVLPPVTASGTAGDRSEAFRLLAMEAVERHGLFYDGTETLFRASVGQTGRFPLEDCIQVSTRQYATGYQSLKPIREEHVISWVNGRLLTTGETAPVPAALAFLGFRRPEEQPLPPADSSGCAAGATLEQATLRALLEAIERDALAIWWYNQVPRPRLALEELASPILRNAARFLQSRGRQLTIFDLTHDLRVPVAAAVTATTAGESLYLGTAADFNWISATERATKEMLQFLFWDEMHAAAPSRRDWLVSATWRTHPFLSPSPEPVPVSTGLSAKNPLKDLVERLERHGLQAIVIDCTRPTIGIPVVRVVVPKLRHHTRRFGPGRLYEVPVKLGWLPARMLEENLNQYVPPL